MSPTSAEWKPSKVAGYMAVSLTKTAHDCTWPDDLRGNAARLLIQDLGESGKSAAATLYRTCGGSNGGDSRPLSSEALS